MAKDSAAKASAPGRVVLFGEHALDLGEPAVAIAIEQRVNCTAQVSSRFMADGEDLDPVKHPIARGAVIQGWTDMDTPIALTLENGIPEELGLGSSGATMAACLGAISMLHDHIIFYHVAKNAFLANREIDERSIPLDTSISTHGGGMLLSSSERGEPLWSFRDKVDSWHAFGIELPEMELVLGYSGTPSPELEMRTKIARFHQRNAFARDIIKEIGQVCMEGYDAIRRNDLEETGRLMGRNHRLLGNLGVGSPALDRMVVAAARHSYGAKITGAGGGGCMIALARDADKACQAIESVGGKALRLTIAGEGLRPED